MMTKKQDQQAASGELASAKARLSQEKISDLICMQIWDDITYWLTQPEKTERERMEGLAFSILVQVDKYSDSTLHDLFYYFKTEE